MIHLSSYAEPHSHATVAQARECEAEMYSDYMEAKSIIDAENAWLRAAEYDPRLAEETSRELAYEEMMCGMFAPA